MQAAVIIPARFASTRFPGKPLAPLSGKPMIQHVYERAKASKLASKVMVATDSPEIVEAVARFGGEAVLTSPDHASGTDRIAEAASRLDCDIIVNVQGDEPLIAAEVIDAAIGLLSDERAAIGTMVTPIKKAADITDPNVVKAVFDSEGFALYFSRSAIPYHRDSWTGGAALSGGVRVYKHIGIYSYMRSALIKFTSLKPSVLEQTEKLEQLRALENGIRIKIGITEYESIGVDTPEDLERVRLCLSSSS